MFGIQLDIGLCLIIASIVGILLSMVPATFWESIKPKISVPVIPDSSPKVADVDPSAKYLEAQRKLLEIRALCKECPEAQAAIDAAIKATVAMVVTQ